MDQRARITRPMRLLVSMGMVCGVTIVAGGSPAHAASFPVVAAYEMNEGPGASVVTDSGPYGIHGVVGDDILTGRTYDGAVGYRWPYTQPNRPPAKPERIAAVPSDPRLNPESEDYAVEFRYRTTQNFGNIVQKGQNKTKGGYFKFEQPSGYMTCMYKGGNGRQRAVKSSIATNDGEWHVIRCERTDWGIRLYIDGQLNKQLRGSTGNIANDRPLSIGGKENCDQIEVTCDYFTGDIDYVRIERSGGGGGAPVNQPPQARFSTSCDGTTCTFDSGSSSDSDGSIVQRTWSFGDGSSGSGTVEQHTYSSAGSYTATLTVRDDDGATSQESHTVNVGVVSSEISRVSDSTKSGRSRRPSVRIPTVENGDTILLFVTAASGVSMGEPNGGGWQAVDTASGSKGITRVWQKTASSGDSGDNVVVTLSSGAKYNASVVAYRGVAGVSAVAHDVEQSSTSQRETPVVGVPDAGSWAVSHWMHRDSSTTSLTPPSGVDVLVSETVSGGGRPTVLIADSDGPVGGTYGGLTATAGRSSTFGITVTVILAPA